MKNDRNLKVFAVRCNGNFRPSLLTAINLREAKMLACGINDRRRVPARYLKVNLFRGNPWRYVGLSRDDAYEICRVGHLH
jgi:hypothetical protein